MKGIYKSIYIKTLKKCLILTLFAAYFATIAYSLQVDSDNYKALTYFGAGGNVETVGNINYGAGIGQTVIGAVEETNYIINYGIFYTNTTYTLPLASQFFIINISDVGMEWMAFNWT